MMQTLKKLNRHSWLPVLGLLIVLWFPGPAAAGQIAFLTSESDSFLVNRAVQEFNRHFDIQADFFTPETLARDESAGLFVNRSEVIIVDTMIAELTGYLDEHVTLAEKKVYALRGSRDDAALERKGYRFDPEIKVYFDHLSVENIFNLISRVAHQELDPTITYAQVKKRPKSGFYHPDADRIFQGFPSYRDWCADRPGYRENGPWIGLMVYGSSLIEGQVGPIDRIIRRLEAEHWNVCPVFGWDKKVVTGILQDEAGRSRVDLLVSFTLKFQSALDDELLAAVEKLDVPVINAMNLYYSTIAQWKEDPRGIPPLAVAWAIANPEITGLIEPSILTGKVKTRDPVTGRDVFLHRLIEENLEHLVPRIGMWINLRQKPDGDKKVAILFYNHHPGKQNIGASYLNVFKSLEGVIHRLKNEGYRIADREDLDNLAIRNLILRNARNIGSWAPGELDNLLTSGRVVRLPVATYQEWWARLPGDFRGKVIEQWGPVEASDIMIKDGNIIIPAVVLDHLVLLPEPSRGFLDDPHKLYHSPTLYPHHQYIAVYLWLKYGFQADAMVHFGTHATHEWLPGKQAGLSASCPPEVLLTDLPNIYPYIVDDVGEGIQAKRRGRGVLIDHLTPPVKEAGLYHEYSRLLDDINQYNTALTMDSRTAEIRFEQIEEMVRTLGLLRDLDLESVTSENLDRIEHYLIELKTNFMPFGMHTFGRSPEGEARQDTINAIVDRNDGVEAEAIDSALDRSGPREMDNLVRALRGRYIPPGEGNDSFRNPEAIPTGKNFFGFDPCKVPSPMAYELGRRAAEDMIEKSLAEKKRYPEKVGMVLWAVETIRNEGINESTILHLMGIKPLWDSSGRVIGTEVIPGRVLGRPRIDVLINPSGLYRDLFPNLMLFLDQAVQKAVLQTDIENLIRRHSGEIKERLVEKGVSGEEAEALSRLRIFCEKPGSYGNGVSEITTASGLWESEEEIAEIFANYVGHAYGEGRWGVSARRLLKENLKDVDTAVHSMSSQIFGTMDNDDMFMSLGGLSLAVKQESGREPDTLITRNQLAGEVQVENLAQSLGRELRTRYLNPKWIEGMKKEGYAGAREMSHFMEYMWGWQVTVRSAVDQVKWDQAYQVYVEDKYGLELKNFFDQASPWAYQSMTARMLEAVRKGYWGADEKKIQKLAADYALNVVEKGVACCDHTCNNPLLNQMVVSIISLPGLMNPEVVEQFKMAMEKAAQKTLDQQLEKLRDLQQALTDGFAEGSFGEKTADEKPREAETRADQTGSADQVVEGYKMEEVETQDETTEMTSSGVQWYAAVFILGLIGLFVMGWRFSRKRNGIK